MTADRRSEEFLVQNLRPVDNDMQRETFGRGLQRLDNTLQQPHRSVGIFTKSVGIGRAG